MNVPLDRLYDFLQDICNQDVLIYRFLPHGSRKIEDCNPLRNLAEFDKKIKMICHDQETLDSRFYYSRIVDKHFELPGVPHPILYVLFKPSPVYYDHVLLLHSEMNSKDVAWFEQRGSVAVYWWSHALIARDWFRYANVDPILTKPTVPKKDFLIYNRAWSGLREYRIKFTDLVVNHNLQTHCQMTFNPIDDGIHWHDHVFENSSFIPSCANLDEYFQISTVDSTASADYNSSDYGQTAIEVVLETVFDDTKWHLTEKTLRPIACGQPFILVGTPGSLQYLKRYGFQTFSEHIDESYDSILDPVQRLNAVIKLMQSIAELSDKEKQKLFVSLHSVCEYNKQRFFSDEFFNQITEEFLTNFEHAFLWIQKTDSHQYYERDFLRIQSVKQALAV